MTNFIEEFNKYSIRNITISEYNDLQNGKIDILEQLYIKYIKYKDLYFRYDKRISRELDFIIINNLYEYENKITKSNINIYEYLIENYNLLNKTNNINSKDIINNLVIPKYYDELEIKNNPREKKVTKKVHKGIMDDKKIKKKSIPLTLKRNVWNKHIGEDIGKTLCLCCKLTDITQLNFSCGHIISEFNGGELKLNNLKPICISCNSSMGIKNMDDFIQEYGLY
jgi:hypothetical protein